MGKLVDITEKLNFEENPKIKVKDTKIEVNADAETVLKIMGILSDDTSVSSVMKMYELLFDEKERKKIEKLKLKFSDFQILVQTAINLVTGEEQGE